MTSEAHGELAPTVAAKFTRRPSRCPEHRASQGADHGFSQPSRGTRSGHGTCRAPKVGIPPKGAAHAATNRALLIPVLALLLALSLSCAHRPELPTANVGYDRLQAEFAGVDGRALAGRHILLDPGHGGAFPGVVGRDGLSEADANLGVALYLRGCSRPREPASA